MRAFTRSLGNFSGTAHALLIFVICMAVIMLPKALALIDLSYDSERRRAFGGLARATTGVFCETIFSTLHAPLLMLWHTRFVVTNLLGVSVGWWPQKRAAGRHGVDLCHPAALGAHVVRAGLGRVHVVARTVAVLVVHARAGGNGFVHSLERLYQPAQPRRAGAKAGIVSHAGGNRAAAGTGRPPREHESP